jgi:1L-myo-inositol 1-phosphate cytidylyltransferase
MQCLIIAAGMGTRLRSRAPSKPLAPLAGTPLIEQVIRLARAGGASEFLVVTGYESARLEAFLPTLAERIGVPIETLHNPEWERPNGLSVLAAADRLQEESLLLMSDHLFDPEIVRGLLAGRPAGAALTLACDRRLEDPLLDIDDATKLLVGDDARILRIGKTLDSYNAVDTGIFLVTPRLIGALRASVAAGGAGSLSEGVQALAEAGQAWTWDIGDRWWIDVDDPAAFDRAERSLPDALRDLAIS